MAEKVDRKDGPPGGFVPFQVQVSTGALIPGCSTLPELARDFAAASPAQGTAEALATRLELLLLTMLEAERSGLFTGVRGYEVTREHYEAMRRRPEGKDYVALGVQPWRTADARHAVKQADAADGEKALAIAIAWANRFPRRRPFDPNDLTFCAGQLVGQWLDEKRPWPVSIPRAYRFVAEAFEVLERNTLAGEDKS